jgi:hypothetical protein
MREHQDLVDSRGQAGLIRAGQACRAAHLRCQPWGLMKGAPAQGPLAREVAAAYNTRIMVGFMNDCQPQQLPWHAANLLQACHSLAPIHSSGNGAALY